MNEADAAGQIVEVLAPVAVDQTYSYFAPSILALSPGEHVEIPLGRRSAYGVVWEIRGAADVPGNLKTVASRYNRPPLPRKLREFVDWLARYTLTPRGMALRLATRSAEGAESEALHLVYRRTGSAPRRATPTRARVLTAAEGGLVFAKRALAEAAGCSPSVIDALVDDGALEAVVAPAVPIADSLSVDCAPPTLEAEQEKASAALRRSVALRAYQPFLLEGVTGSGKTEVYFEAIAAALEEGEQALVMMPEIALTSQFLERFAKRFGGKPAEWHSAVSERKRTRIWRGCATGEVKVVVGARSALFLPFSKLRLIVVDEEHDGAYKQEDGACYHARDMAVVRARIEGVTIVLSSATPSIESRVNAEWGRYGHLRLRARAGGRLLPRADAIDMRAEGPGPGRWLAPRLALAIGETLARGEQALLYLNRRGYAPLTLCRSCGHRFRCRQCDAWLVEHRFRRALICHHCGHLEQRPNVCPECEAEDTLSPCGPGVERIAEESVKLFPDARILVLSSDFFGGPSDCAVNSMRSQKGLSISSSARSSSQRGITSRI